MIRSLQRAYIDLWSDPALRGRRALAAIGASCLLMASCTSDAPSASESSQLMERVRSWSQAARDGDLDRILDHLTDDAIVIAPGEPERRGKPAIRHFLEENRALPGYSVHLEPISAEVSASGDLGYVLERTTVTVTGPDGRPLSRQFRGLSIWRKEAGKWRNSLEISNVPPED
jgi:ketosteroid isomerase-like protein